MVCKMSSIILRVDGSGRIGMGHIMRCIGLAQGFKEIGKRSVFVTKDYEPQMLEMLRDTSYDVETIPKGSNFTEDASLTLNFACRHGAKVVITDMSNQDAMANISGYSEYLSALKHAGMYSVTIDGFNRDCISDKLAIAADIVIIPYYGAEKKRYKTNGTTNFLLGASFFIFRQEFMAVSGVKRQLRNRISNILVSMGGSDPFNYTVKVVDALADLDRPRLCLKVVAGTGFASAVKGEIANILENSKCNYEIISRTNNMARLLLWSDLVITSSGLTVYEAAVTGTPGIVFSQYDYHEKMMDSFSKAGTFLHLGYGAKIDKKAIVDTIERLSDDSVLRSKMSENGKKLVDGKGVNRVISSIPKELMI